MCRVLIRNMSIWGSQPDTCIRTFRSVPIDDGEHTVCVLLLGSSFHIMTQILEFPNAGLFGLMTLLGLQVSKSTPVFPDLKASTK